MKFSESELREIEKQLSCPEGEEGVKIGENMNESNLSMTMASIESLRVSSADRILEIGHGNCGHLEKLLKIASDIRYVGLEISETMKKEAKRINSHYLVDDKITFLFYDGVHIPMPDSSFSKIFTVNTIYFWSEPLDLLMEINRVLRKGGTLVLTFAQKRFMKDLPFVKERFTLYDSEDVELLLDEANFKQIEILDKSERAKSKTGEWHNRAYSVIRAKKI